MSEEKKALRITCFRARKDLADLAKDELVVSIFALIPGEDICSFRLARIAAKRLHPDRIASATEKLVGASSIPENQVAIQPDAIRDEISIAVIPEEMRSKDLRHEKKVSLKETIEGFLTSNGNSAEQP